MRLLCRVVGDVYGTLPDLPPWPRDATDHWIWILIARIIGVEPLFVPTEKTGVLGHGSNAYAGEAPDVTAFIAIDYQVIVQVTSSVTDAKTAIVDVSLSIV